MMKSYLLPAWLARTFSFSYSLKIFGQDENSFNCCSILFKHFYFYGFLVVPRIFFRVTGKNGQKLYLKLAKLYLRKTAMTAGPKGKRVVPSDAELSNRE